MNVPFVDLRAQHGPLAQEILSSWGKILDDGGFVGGEHIEGFEREFAAACGADHAVSVASGTDALRFAFLAKGVAPGDEVLVPANSFIATAEAVTQAGATPVFVDSDPQTHVIDPAAAAAAVTSRTRGIAAVHLYGQTADMDALGSLARAHNLWIVEDAAQAHLAEFQGRRAGSLGDAAAFSFYPSKNLGACGEAGAVVTNDAAVADRVRMLRDHGQTRKYLHAVEGYNGRCDALQAAALRIKLRHLPRWNEQRRALAARYVERLRSCEDITLPTTAPDCLPVWHLFVVQLASRNVVQAALTERGVATGIHYPVPLHLQPAYARLRCREGSLPNAERCAQRILSLPMYAEMPPGHVDYVCATLREILSAQRA